MACVVYVYQFMVHVIKLKYIRVCWAHDLNLDMEPASVQRSSYTQRENMQSTFCGELRLNLVTQHGLARLKEKMV